MPDFGKAWWLAPNNIVYDVPHTHWGWMMVNKKLLANDYGITNDLLGQYDFGGYGNIECSLLIDKGWIQIRLWKKQLNIIMATESQIGRIFNFINNNFINNSSLEFKQISVDTTDSGFDIYTKEEFYNKYKTVTSAKNTMGQGWWIAPDGAVMEIPDDLSHWGWMEHNQKLLENKYNIFGIDKEVWDLIRLGWFRVRVFKNQLQVDCKDSSNLYKVINFIYDNDIIKNVNGILNIKDVYVNQVNGQSNLLNTKDFLRKYSKLHRIKSIKQEIINEFLQ